MDIATSSRQVFQGVVGTFTAVPGAAVQPSINFNATIDWGDGRARTPGQVEPTSGGYVVLGIHTFADISSTTAVLDPIAITLGDLVGGTHTSAVGQATVAPLRIHLDGQLASSGSMAATSLRAFSGESTPFTMISDYARPLSGGTAVRLGATEANGAGAWQLVDGTPLFDGQFNVYGIAAAQGGVNSGTATFLPAGNTGPLTVDTRGPCVTALQLDPRSWTFTMTFQDSPSGLDPASLVRLGERRLRPRLHAKAAEAWTGLPGDKPARDRAHSRRLRNRDWDDQQCEASQPRHLSADHQPRDPKPGRPPARRQLLRHIPLGRWQSGRRLCRRANRPARQGRRPAPNDEFGVVVLCSDTAAPPRRCMKSPAGCSEPALEPGECLGLHRAVELVWAGVERAPVSVRAPALAKTSESIASARLISGTVKSWSSRSFCTRVASGARRPRISG